MNKHLILALSQICGSNNLLSDAALITPYSQDWRKRYYTQALAVALPQTTLQLQQLINYCRQQQIAIVPQGGNTSTCGASVPLAGYQQPQLIINLARMNKILTLNRDNLSLSVEAGCTLQQVQNYAAAQQLYFPLSLASQGSCQIGGNIATNAGGIQVLKYGMMRDLTLGLEVVLANGNILHRLHELRKNNMYLDLKQLFIGSEGTLGIISKAVLKLYPQPKDYCTLALGVTELASAMTLLNNLRQHYLNNVSAFEIIKRDSLELYQRYFNDHWLELDHEWLIIAELETNGDFNQEQLLTILKPYNLNNCLIASNLNERQQLWQLRERIPLAEKQHGFAAKHDISLPLNKIAEFLALNMPKLRQVAPDGYFSIFGHLGDGNLHYNFGRHDADATNIQQLEALVTPLVYADIHALGGSIAAEHGIGYTKKTWLKQYSDPTSYKLYTDLKQLLDPQQLFNPGKILY